MHARHLFLAVIVATLSLPARPVAARAPCVNVADLIMSAFARRLARDSGNLLGRNGVDLDLATYVTLGDPDGNAAPRVRDKLERLWKHTENKIHRKCSDTDARRLFPTVAAADTRAVTDELFNVFGLPWIERLRELTRPHGARCAQAAIVQAGYAARDQIRRGADIWSRYGRRVATLCPPDLFDQIKIVTAEHLGEMRARVSAP